MHIRLHPTLPGRLAFAIIAVLAIWVGNEAYATGISWGYSEDNGPEHWGKDFAMCGMGRNQAPINIATRNNTLDISGIITEQQTIASRPVGFLKINFNYQKVPLRIINNGHTVQVNYETGSQMIVHGRTSGLQQFHFHSPSENQIDGESFPMEIHLVHADENDNLTVVSVLFQEGAPNPFLGTLWKHLPQQVGREVVVAEEEINVADMLPRDSTYYYYNGSLTTPPCSEGVSWLVLKESLEASREQIDMFRATMGFANNRPVQPVNARVVLTW